MILYAESSAVLAWLFGEPQGEPVRENLGAAEVVLACDLTPLECDRVIIRAVSTGRVSEALASDLRARLRRTVTHWTLLSLDSPILERARRPFPREPVRTLDALHLAAMLEARSAVPELSLLSLDQRIRSNGYDLGFELLPLTA